MTDILADLQRQMDEAAERLDYETASRLRDQISIVRGGGDGTIDTAGLTRQQPGSMGIARASSALPRPRAG